MGKNKRLSLKNIPVQYKMLVRPYPATEEELQWIRNRYKVSDEYMAKVEEMRQYIFGDK